MKGFIEKLEKIINVNNRIENTQVALSTEDMYIIHIYGYKGHVFSIKIAAFPENIICFFGYDREITLPLNDENFDSVVDLINKAINFGTRIIETYNGKNVGIYEFIAEDRQNPRTILNLYKLENERSGKALCPCRLSCSDFCGSNIFEVEVTNL